MTPYLIDFVEARAELAARQRREQRRIDDDQRRRMKRADQVLALRMVDADLAADRAVDLREQRRRHLDDGDAAQVRRRGEAGDVAERRRRRSATIALARSAWARISAS